MSEWQNMYMDEQLRLKLPVDALGEMGWGWNEPLTLSVSPGGTALVLRSQNTRPPECCACHAGGPLLPVRYGRWLCQSCFETAAFAQAKK